MVPGNVVAVPAEVPKPAAKDKKAAKKAQVTTEPPEMINVIKVRTRLLCFVQQQRYSLGLIQHSFPLSSLTRLR